jgi:dCMP deaminase
VTRPSWDDYAMNIAEAVSVRGDCTRRRVGAVILDVAHRVVAVGYNGGRAGGPSCLKGECPRGRHYQWTTVMGDCPGNLECGDWSHGPGCPATPVWICRCEKPWPCPDAAEPGSSYDTGPGACIAVHAEMNALLDVDNRARLDGATLYVTEEPCGGCLKILRSTALARVTWLDGSLQNPF